MVDHLRAIGRDVGDIAASLTTWDYPILAATMARSVLEEVPASLKLLRTTEAAGLDAAARPDDGARRESSPGNSALPKTCR